MGQTGVIQREQRRRVGRVQHTAGVRLAIYTQINHLPHDQQCTRWHAAKFIPDKFEATLTKAIDELWVSTHGASKELILDGESVIFRSE